MESIREVLEMLYLTIQPKRQIHVNSSHFPYDPFFIHHWSQTCLAHRPPSSYLFLPLPVLICLIHLSSLVYIHLCFHFSRYVPPHLILCPFSLNSICFISASFSGLTLTFFSILFFHHPSSSFPLLSPAPSSHYPAVRIPRPLRPYS